MTTLQCNHCTGPIVLNVGIKNIFGKIKVRLMANKIRLTYSGLIAKDVEIEPLELMCQHCGRTLKEDEIRFRCDFSGKKGLLSEFFLIKPTRNEKRLRKMLMHESYLETWEKEAKIEEIEFVKIRVKLEIDKKEVKDE